MPSFGGAMENSFPYGYQQPDQFCYQQQYRSIGRNVVPTDFSAPDPAFWQDPNVVYTQVEPIPNSYAVTTAAIMDQTSLIASPYLPEASSSSSSSAANSANVVTTERGRSISSSCTSATSSMVDDVVESPKDLSKESHATLTQAEVSMIEQELTVAPVEKRKRGRPRIHRPKTELPESSKPVKSRISKRLPHNQIERKYREGLNSELERLRLAIPTLPQWDSQLLGSQAKPSKATVLSSAVEYIHSVESERDQLREELAALKSTRGLPVAQSDSAEDPGGW